MNRFNRLPTAAVIVTSGLALGLSDIAPSDVAAPSVGAVEYTLEPIPAREPLMKRLTAEPRVLRTLTGSASYYANSLAGRRTASGVPYDPQKMIAAHKTLPFGTLLRVTNEANGRSVEVEVVDRGPYAYGRVLDLSRVAAERLGFIRQGHTRVTIEVLEPGE